jgi:hypothetical protein
VQVTAGTTGEPVEVPMNPNVVPAPAARAPFHAALVAVTAAPLVVRSAPQNWVTACPDGLVHPTRQPVIAAAPAVILTSPWKPPGQEPVTVYVAVHARPAPPPVVVVVTGRDVVVVDVVVTGRDVVVEEVVVTGRDVVVVVVVVGVVVVVVVGRVVVVVVTGRVVVVIVVVVVVVVVMTGPEPGSGANSAAAGSRRLLKSNTAWFSHASPDDGSAGSQPLPATAVQAGSQ